MVLYRNKVTVEKVKTVKIKSSQVNCVPVTTGDATPYNVALPFASKKFKAS